MTGVCQKNSSSLLLQTKLGKGCVTTRHYFAIDCHGLPWIGWVGIVLGILAVALALALALALAIGNWQFAVATDQLCFSSIPTRARTGTGTCLLASTNTYSQSVLVVLAASTTRLPRSRTDPSTEKIRTKNMTKKVELTHSFRRLPCAARRSLAGHHGIHGVPMWSC